MVEATGFEPAASASRTQRSTKLSHASTYIKLNTNVLIIILTLSGKVKLIFEILIINIDCILQLIFLKQCGRLKRYKKGALKRLK